MNSQTLETYLLAAFLQFFFVIVLRFICYLESFSILISWHWVL